jgi:hypothetical protein
MSTGIKSFSRASPFNGCFLLAGALWRIKWTSGADMPNPTGGTFSGCSSSSSLSLQSGWFSLSLVLCCPYRISIGSGCNRVSEIRIWMPNPEPRMSERPNGPSKKVFFFKAGGSSWLFPELVLRARKAKNKYL